MSPAALFAWSVFGVSLLLRTASIVLVVRSSQDPWDVVISAAYGVPTLVFLVVGALLVTHHPRNPVGWLALVLAIEPIGGFAWDYAMVAVSHPGTVPAAGAAAWVASWLAPPVPTLVLPGLLLYFPTGRLPSRRWRPLAWAIVALVLVIVAASAFAAEPLTLADDPVSNPLAAPGRLGEWLTLAQNAAWAAFPLLVLAAIASLVTRFRAADRQERHQLRWILYSACLITAALLAAFAGITVGLANDTTIVVANLVFAFALATLPVAIGVAVLRYRLYEIDRIVSRTASYAIVTALLAATYGIVVIVLRTLLPVRGQLAVAASTLVVAALFDPLRRRVQRVVERRFNRRRYDAARAIEAFSQRVRSQLTLADLGGELRRVTAETVQPAQVSVWLRRTARE